MKLYDAYDAWEELKSWLILQDGPGAEPAYSDVLDKIEELECKYE
jgi:hypothetical protein